ncbi:FKBP-type peptidyl-prolyl cis-trans isomerase [Enterobacter cloacae complex sp. P32C]|uniref:FKBP-type peptidyl-prolyl cis-trans isomerase N-terminal domain-containing protein n=1 Tax=Enterobacter cloacae complex sp. P32C TaxID=2779559 RepID=UPI0018677FFD|nr:FKBP-type peptidyl-prolyl cis-trans isomerase N-terminal domain-containing protein [Enterobacter cloacae complex sp. P32C]MBE3210335.1 FKBP-type peptidyl-prolyl cis-trans isomerase [Enterobacter cloacae complex sp. P32C]
MIVRYRLLVGMLLFLYGSGAFANDDIPALLQFAEKYQENQTVTESSPDKAPSPAKNTSAQDKASPRGSAEVKKPVTAGKPASVSAMAVLKKTLQSQAAELRAQRATIAQLEKRLADVKFAAPTTQVPDAFVPDLQRVSNLAKWVRQALAITPEEQTMLEQTRQLRAREAENTAQLAEKENALSATQRELIGLQKTLLAKDAEKAKVEAAQTALRMQLTEQGKAYKVLSAQRDEAERTRQALDVQLTAERQHGAQLQADIVALRERAKWLAAPQTLKTDASSQAYAAGVSLGRDIQSMLEERKTWGMKTDLRTLLSGIIDTFTGQYQLPTDVLDKEMLAAESTAAQAREKAGQRQRVKGEDFLAGFKKQKGVKQSPSGFWYRVEHIGDTPIAADAIVDVVVKELLTDGTVIQDMDMGGKVLSQPLAAYPPLFREAIGYLHNHGSVILVVPPELAYGEAGYPPKIPPYATMIYELRVEDVKVTASK